MRFLRPLAAASVLGLVLLAFWFGRYRYFQYPRELVRVNRFSGSTSRLTAEGWKGMERAPTARGMRGIRTPTPLDSIAAAERGGTDTSGSPLYDEYVRTLPKKPAQKSTPLR